MLFHIVLGACAVEDACTGFVSTINLGLLLAVALATFFAQDLPVHVTMRHGSGALLLSGPFAFAAVRGRAGWADPAGVLAIGLRYPFLRSCVVVVLACALGLAMAGATALRGTKMSTRKKPPAGTTTRAVPFFPGLALAALIFGCLASASGWWL